jgi:hypothetical protein
VPSACARPAAGTTSTAPGGRAGLRLAARGASLQILRRTTHLRTHRLPMVCTHFGLATHIPVSRSARSTAGSALWSTPSTPEHDQTRSHVCKSQASARSASGAKRTQVGRSARQLRTALTAANARRTGRASCSKHCTLCSQAGHWQKSGSWRAPRVRQVQCSRRDERAILIGLRYLGLPANRLGPPTLPPILRPCVKPHLLIHRYAGAAERRAFDCKPCGWVCACASGCVRVRASGMCV